MKTNIKWKLVTYASLLLTVASPVSSTVMAANSTSTKISTSKKVATNNQATTKRNSIVGQSSETTIDVLTGWNVIEDSGDGNDFKENDLSNPTFKMTGFGDTHSYGRTTTAKKVIPMKKGHIYNLDLIYFDGFYTYDGAQIEGYIDFNGDKKLATEYTDNTSVSTTNSYKKTIAPTQDMDYTITIHVTSDGLSALSFKVGYLTTSNGITDKSGMVTSKYVDEQGNKIADDEVETGGFGDSYTTSQKDIAGYTFKEVQGNPSGVFEDKEQTVTYVYTKSVDKSSIDGSDVTKYVGDKLPADSEFKATATDKDGNSVGVTIDKSKVDMSKAGDYDVVITADDGQTKTVQVHVLPNQQSIKGSDVTKYVGDAIPGDSEFKASATGKDGKDISVTLDKSKVDMSKAGDYNVVLTTSDGQSKTVVVHVLPNKQSITGSDVTKYVGDAMPVDSEFKASAKDIDGNDSAVTLDKSKVDMSKVGDYDVLITSKDGQTKTVQVHVKEKNDVPTTPDDSTVIVEYVDEDGNVIAEQDVLTGHSGDTYTTKAKKVKGYTLIEEPANKNGVFVKGTQTLVYKYTKEDGVLSKSVDPSKDYKEQPKNQIKHSDKKLPQTGESGLEVSTISIAGVVTLLSAVYLFLGGKRKSENNG